MKSLWRKMSLAVGILVLALALASCAQSAQQLEPVTYQIDMIEYAFEPGAIELRVGQEATFELTNSGQLDHEIMFGREVVFENNRPAGYRVDMFETANVHPEVISDDQLHAGEGEHAGFMVLLPPGGRATITFPVTPEMAGEWEMGCFEQEGVHYDAGMVGTLTVQR
jgi:uncharacterized cupredoxin-like copper-binding protein